MWFLLRFLWLFVLTLGIDTKDQGVRAKVECGALRIGKRCSGECRTPERLPRTWCLWSILTDEWEREGWGKGTQRAQHGYRHKYWRHLCLFGNVQEVQLRWGVGVIRKRGMRWSCQQNQIPCHRDRLWPTWEIGHICRKWEEIGGLLVEEWDLL